MQPGVVMRTSNMKISCSCLADHIKKLHQKAHAHAACAARLFFTIQLVQSLICGVHIAVAIVISLTTY